MEDIDPWVAEDDDHDEPRAWTNTETDAVLAVIKDTDRVFDYGQDHDGEWMVTSDSRVIHYDVATVREARQKAVQYMSSHPTVLRED